jgi:hypothetical protein
MGDGTSVENQQYLILMECCILIPMVIPESPDIAALGSDQATLWRAVMIYLHPEDIPCTQPLNISAVAVG